MTFRRLHVSISLIIDHSSSLVSETQCPHLSDCLGTGYWLRSSGELETEPDLLGTPASLTTGRERSCEVKSKT